MEKIFEGMLNSSHPDEVKAMVVEKIAQAANTTKDEDAAIKMFSYCSRVIAESPSLFNVSRAKKVISVWTKEHSSVAVQFVSDAVEKNFVRPSDNCCLVKSKWLDLVTLMFSSITLSTHTSFVLVLQKLVKSFLQEENLEISSYLAKTIIQNWDKASVSGQEVAIITKMINLLKGLEFDFKGDTIAVSEDVQESLVAKVKQINLISALFAKVINLENSYMQFALTELFKELSSDNCSVDLALASLLHSIPIELSTVAAEIFAKDKTLKDKNVGTVFKKLIEWLSWPGIKNLDIWIVKLLRNMLMQGRRGELIMELIGENILKIFQHLRIPESRETALPIFTFTMLVHQHSPEAFLKVAPKIPLLILKIKQESDAASGQLTIKIIAELVHTLMHKFPGYPSIYSSLLQAIKDYPKPSELNMERWLSESYYFGSNQPAPPSNLEIQLPKKSETGKTGLSNLGNTCYMNSVIQALFMLERFRSSLLSMSLDQSRDVVTSSLQKLVAHLLLSKRYAISPVDFHKVSRPSWFRQGAQQDCSEFLKYLIDVIEQEDKARCAHEPAGQQPEELHKLFTGECRVDIKCLNCHYVSSRFEAYNDIPLSFPDNTEGGTCSLKGGDISHGLANTIANTAGSITPIDANEVTKASDLPLPESTAPTVKNRGHHAGKDDMVDQSMQQNVDSGMPLDLQGLVNTYLSAEDLNGQNQYRCDNCDSLQDAEQKHYFASCPKYLVLTLKRFTFDMKSLSRSKILKNVHYPLKLTIPMHEISHEEKVNEDSEMPDADEELVGNANCPVNCKPDLLTGKGCKTAKLAMVTETIKEYALVAVIVHSGISSESGHYYCYSRKGPTSPSSTPDMKDASKDHTSFITDGSNLYNDMQTDTSCSTNSTSLLNETEHDNRWFIFNDSNVSFADENTIQNLSKRLPRDTPYVFIYEEIDCMTSLQSKGINPELALLVESDNRKLRDEELSKRSRANQTASRKFYKYDRKDDGDNDGGDGSSGNCGGAFPGLSQDANRFIF